MTIPRVEFKIDSNDPLMGVKTISMVSDPAILSDFVFFSKQKSMFIELKGEKYKQIVAGLALIPDKDIYRVDANGNPYHGYFSKETIEAIRLKFSKEQLSNRVNLEHSSKDYIDAVLLDNYIIESEEQLAHVKKLGIDEAVIGAWFVSYKIESPDVFQNVIDGKIRGFSVEVFLQHLHSVNNTNKFESYMSTLIDKIKELLAEVQKDKQEETKLAEGTTADGKKIQYGEVGSEVNIIDEEGNASPAPDGDYTVDGKIISVASGVATEIKDAPAEEEQKKEEKMQSSIYATYILKDDRKVNVSVQDMNEVTFWDGEKNQSVPVETGEYELKEGGFLLVEDGKFLGLKDAPDAKSFDDKKELVENKAELRKAKAEIARLQSELESINVEIERFKKKPLAKPVTKVVKKVEEVDESQLSVMERIAIKNGIELPDAILKQIKSKK